MTQQRAITFTPSSATPAYTAGGRPILILDNYDKDYDHVKVWEQWLNDVKTKNNSYVVVRNLSADARIPEDFKDAPQCPTRNCVLAINHQETPGGEMHARANGEDFAEGSRAVEAPNG